WAISVTRSSPVREAFLVPGIGLVVIAVPLPESGRVAIHELDPREPLGALPEVAPRDHEPQRPAMVGRECLAIVLVREQNVIVVELREGEIGGETLLRVDQREPGQWL